MRERLKVTFNAAMQINESRTCFITMIVTMIVAIVLVFVLKNSQYGIIGSMGCAMVSLAEGKQFLRMYSEILKEYDEEQEATGGEV